MQTGLTYTGNIQNSAVQTLLSLLGATPAAAIKTDLDAIGQSPAVLRQYAASDFLADLTDAVIIGIITGATQPDVNSGLDANTNKGVIIENITPSDIVANIVAGTQILVVQSMSSGNVITALTDPSYVSLRNGVQAGIYAALNTAKNGFYFPASSTVSQTADANWHIANITYLNCTSGNVLSITVNGGGVSAPFNVASGQVVAIQTTGLSGAAGIVLNGYKTF